MANKFIYERRPIQVMQIKVGDIDIKIRKANCQDYDYCYKLFKRNMYHLIDKHWGWKKGKFRSNFIPSEVKILEHNNKRFGFYQTSINNGDYYIREIQISNRFKGKGIGSNLLKIIHNEAKKKDYNIISLRVFKDNPAKRLYERLGYNIIKDEGSSVLMEKRL